MELAVLSEGTQRALAFEGITTRSSLAAKSREELKRLPGIGPIRLNEIERFLKGVSALNRRVVEQTIAEVLLGELGTARASEYAAAIASRLRELGVALGPAGPRQFAARKSEERDASGLTRRTQSTVRAA